MATSNDHPGLPFVQARGFTAGRPDGPPLWIVIHDMEASETPTRAESTAAYFANPSDGRRVSSHYCVDDDSVVQCVDLDDSAWTVGNRQGNNRGINWELSGFASQTRAQWLDPFGLAMFRQMAPIVRSDGQRFGIPLRWLTDDQVRAMQPGLTTHAQLARVFGGSTHTDPGPAFPYDVFLSIMTGDDMEQSDPLERPTDRPKRTIGDVFADLSNWRNWLYSPAAGGTVLVNPPLPGSIAHAMLERPDVTMTPEQIADLGAAIGEALAATLPAAVRTIVREELDKTRLAG